MRWRKRDHADQAGHGSVEVVRAGNGLLVLGEETAVESWVARITETAGSARQIATDGLSVASATVAFVNAHQTYVQFSDEALRRLREHGAIATADGFYRSFVKDRSQFAGNLDWKPVTFSPEQAVALQAVTAQLALRAAIHEVTAAIERVEGKVDTLVTLARAERLGAALADRETLARMLERAERTGAVTHTDWSSIAPLGPVIARDVMALRSYVTSSLDDVESSRLTRSRANELEDLSDRMLTESIDLLVVAQANLAMWNQLRLAHAARFEPDAAAEIAADVQLQLAEARVGDQELLNALCSVVDGLLAPTGFEGFAPLQRRRLRRFGGDLHDVGRRFAEHRQLDLGVIEVSALPGLAESLDKVRDAVGDAARVSGRVIGDSPAWVRRRLAPPDAPGITPQLTSGDDVYPEEPTA